MRPYIQHTLSPAEKSQGFLCQHLWACRHWEVIGQGGKHKMQFFEAAALLAKVLSTHLKIKGGSST